MKDTNTVLKVGCLAFFDSFSGLVPCKVTAIIAREPYSAEVRFTLTGSRGPYKRGEKQTGSVSCVVPRGAIFKRRGSPHQRIGRYTVDYPTQALTEVPQS